MTFALRLRPTDSRLSIAAWEPTRAAFEGTAARRGASYAYREPKSHRF
jgi:hypothetical protein